jgi:PAT family beta-lactamase induction signal transducer AmpG
MPQTYTKPFYIFFLMLPTGISNGFISVVLPFLLTRNGFPVSVTAGIVALGLSANLWRFLWGPVVDMSLSLHKWFWIGLLSSTALLLLLCFTPFTVKGTVLLSVIVFLSQVAATFILLPINGFMARRIEESQKGKASGWYQAGSLAGTGFSGGAGLWMATHFGVAISGIVLCTVSLLVSLVILLIQDIHHDGEKKILDAITGIGKDIFAMIKIPAALLVMVLIVTPIGTGAMANLWSAIAQDWKADENTVVLVTGLLSGGISALGCVAGGYIADRWGVWVAYLGTGSVCALVTLIMAVMPGQPIVYISGVLVYAFSMGMIYAAFTAIILYAIGKKHVATKFSLLASLGNLPVVYMTTFDGWTHDKYNSRYMLTAEALAGFLFVLIFFLILRRMMYKKMIPAIIE